MTWVTPLHAPNKGGQTGTIMGHSALSMSGYTKLFNTILASTIWDEPDHVRIVWITLLAMADKHGLSEGSVPGLAKFARVSRKACDDALRRLTAPDKDSRTKEHEGRRIETVDGGWRILNHAKYRAKLSQDDRREYDRQRKAKYRAEKRDVPDVPDSHGQSAESAQAEAKADTEASTPLPPSRGGRLTRDELKIAKHVRSSLGGCTHQPTCDSYDYCLRRLVLQGRKYEAAP